MLQSNINSSNNTAKLYNSIINFINLDGDNKSTVGYIKLKGTGNNLFIEDEQFSSCWYSNGNFNPSKNVSGSIREDFMTVMKNGNLDYGEGIVLESNITLNSSINFKSGWGSSGDIYLYLDEFYFSGGKLKLDVANPVISDTANLSNTLFICDEGYSISEVTITDPFDNSKNAYKYTVVASTESNIN